VERSVLAPSIAVVTPGMTAGVVETIMNMTDVVGLIDARAAETPMVRGPYKKKIDENFKLRHYRMISSGSRISLIRWMISVTAFSARKKGSKPSPLRVVPSVRSASAARIAA
jgi:hypothetical protein